MRRLLVLMFCAAIAVLQPLGLSAQPARLALESRPDDSAQVREAQRARAEINTFNRLGGRLFASVVSPQAASSIGNFGSYTSADGKIAFAGTARTKRGHLATLMLSGSGVLGVLPMISNQSVTKDLAADVQFHFIGGERPTIWYDRASYYQYRAALEAADADAAPQRHASRRITRRLALDSALRSATAALKVVQDSMPPTTGAVTTQCLPIPELSEECRSNLRRRAATDSLTADVARLTSELAAELREAERDYLVAERARANAHALAVEAAEAKVKATSYDLAWLSMGYGVSVAQFKAFDPAAVADSQVKQVQFATHEVRLQWNDMSYDAGTTGTKVLFFGATARLADNRDQLRTIELTEKSEHGTTPGARTSSSTYKALQGEYRRDQKELRLFAEYYALRGSGSSLGIHLFPTLRLLERAKGALDVGLGAMSVVQRPDSQTVRFNIELYLLFRDMTESVASDDNIWERGQLGVRFSVPLTFKPMG